MLTLPLPPFFFLTKSTHCLGFIYSSLFGKCVLSTWLLLFIFHAFLCIKRIIGIKLSSECFFNIYIYRKNWGNNRFNLANWFSFVHHWGHHFSVCFGSLSPWIHVWQTRPPAEAESTHPAPRGPHLKIPLLICDCGYLKWSLFWGWLTNGRFTMSQGNRTYVLNCRYT